jgi:hypothetical protein
MMARSTKGSNQRPDTLMQGRTSPNSEKSSCNARPDHTLGSRPAIRRCRLHVRFARKRTWLGSLWSTPVVPARCQEGVPSSRASIVITYRVQSDDHQVQTNLAAAKATTHAIRSRNIETAKLACFLNSLRPSLIRVVRREKIERTKRKIGIAAATNAMILKSIFHRRPWYGEGNSFVGCLPANGYIAAV